MWLNHRHVRESRVKYIVVCFFVVCIRYCFVAILFKYSIWYHMSCEENNSTKNSAENNVRTDKNTPVMNHDDMQISQSIRSGKLVQNT